MNSIDFDVRELSHQQVSESAAELSAAAAEANVKPEFVIAALLNDIAYSLRKLREGIVDIKDEIRELKP